MNYFTALRLEKDSEYMNVCRADLLRSKDFKAHAVWQLVNNDKRGEATAEAVTKLPVESLDAKLIGVEFTLANGQIISGYAGNVSRDSAEQNQHFLTLAFFRNDSVFHLARYFDEDYQKNGPGALADFLHLTIEDVFPIQYDFTHLCLGASEILKGNYPVEIEAKLSIVELAVLAVPALPNTDQG